MKDHGCLRRAFFSLDKTTRHVVIWGTNCRRLVESGQAAANRGVLNFPRRVHD